MKWSIKDIKTQIEAANKLNENVSITASRVDGDYVKDGRDISINATYYHLKDEGEDIYPHWEIEMREEELTTKLYLGGNELKKVRDILNGFMNQKDKSFIEDVVYNY